MATANYSSWSGSIAHWGVTKTIYRKFLRFLRPWFFLCRVRSRELGKTPLQAPIGDLEIRYATLAEMLDACNDPELGQLDTDWVKAAFERGDWCLATFDGGKIVSYGWTTFVSCPHTSDVSVEFDKPYRYGFKSFTRASYRGRGVSGGMFSFTDSRCLELGYTRTISFVETHNYSSLRAAQKNENTATVVGYAGYARLFGHVFPFRTPGVKKHTFRFSATK